MEGHVDSESTTGVEQPTETFGPETHVERRSTIQRLKNTRVLMEVTSAPCVHMRSVRMGSSTPMHYSLRSGIFTFRIANNTSNSIKRL